MSLSEKQLLTALDAVLAEQALQGDTDMLEQLKQSRAEVSAGNDFITEAAKIHEHLSLYLLSHHYQAPQSVLDIAKLTQRASNVVRGASRNLFDVANHLFKKS